MATAVSRTEAELAKTGQHRDVFLRQKTNVTNRWEVTEGRPEKQ